MSAIISEKSYIYQDHLILSDVNFLYAGEFIIPDRRKTWAAENLASLLKRFMLICDYKKAEAKWLATNYTDNRKKDVPYLHKIGVFRIFNY
jgi:hypothetical protein